MRALVVVALAVAPAMAAAAPPTPDELRARLPKVDFVAALDRTTVDPERESRAVELNVAGLELYRKKDYTGAEAKYKAALEANPGHLLARYNLACAYNLSGQSDKGLALLDELASATHYCKDCKPILRHALWDDDWRSQWGELAFLAVLGEAAEPDRGPGDEIERLACPKGTKQKGKWDENALATRAHCAKPDGTKHGPYRERELGYDLGEGRREVRGEYRDGKKHGPWMEFETYGRSTWGAYVDDRPHGLWYTQLSPDGDYEYAVYFRGVKESWTHRYDSADRLERELRYENDKKHGPYRRWEPETGLLSEEGEWHADAQHGAWTIYDVKGRKRIFESWDKGVRHGTFQYWDASGKLLGEAKLDRGTGDWIAYDVDGRKMEQGRLVAGVREGKWGLFEGGWYTGEYEKGKRTGVWTLLDDEGGTATWMKGTYDAGKRHGAWTYWWENGEVRLEGAYVSDQPDGTWVFYDEDGKTPTQTLLFRRGKLREVNGKRAGKDYQRAFEYADFEKSPRPLEPVTEED